MNLSDGGNVSGSQTATLSLSNALSLDNGGYSVIVSNSYGSVTSLVATLTVLNSDILPPAICTGDGSFGWQTGQFGFNLTSMAGRVVVIEASTNLVDWTALATNTFGTAPLYFSDPGSTNFPSRFYRVRMQ